MTTDPIEEMRRLIAIEEYDSDDLLSLREAVISFLQPPRNEETPRPYDKQRDILVGLEIFRKHGGIHVQAEHDEVYAGQGDGQVLTEAEILTLYEHGWMHDPCDGCADDLPDDDPGIAPVKSNGDEHRHLRSCSEWGIYV